MPSAHALRSSSDGATGSVAVFAPSPLLTVTIEAGAPTPEVHIHAGGQGFWVARLAATLDAQTTLCCALGGESGRVLRGLIEAEPLLLAAAESDAPNGVYVHDRRSGERVEVVSVESRPLARHAADALYGIALGAGLDADVVLLTGCQPSNLVSADFYRRLARDLRTNGRTVIADLTGPPLKGALAGGVALLKLSLSELIAERDLPGDSLYDVIAAGQSLQRAGAEHVVVSRASQPALLIKGMRHPHWLSSRARYSSPSTSAVPATPCSPLPGSDSPGA